jgi:hypothetical protein
VSQVVDCGPSMGRPDRDSCGILLDVTWFNAVLPVLTLIAGFLGSYQLEIRRDRRAVDRERAMRAAERREADDRDRNIFERQGLLEVHQCVRSLANAVHAMIFTPVGKATAARLDWREVEGADALRQTIMDANVRLSHTKTLLLSEPVIRSVERVGRAAHPIYMTQGSAWDDAARGKFYDAIDDVFRAIAARMKDLYGFAIEPFPPDQP